MSRFLFEADCTCIVPRNEAVQSRSEGVGPFDRKARFSNLWRVCWSDARKLGPNVIDDVEIAVGPVVVAQPKVRAHGLGVRGVHLNEACKGQKAIERVARPSRSHLHVVNLVIQLKAIPLGCRGKTQVRVGVVCRFWDWGLISSRLPDAHLLGPRDNCGRDFFRRGMGCSAAYRPAGVGTHVGAFDLPTCHPPLARTSLCLQRKPINSESFSTSTS